MKTFGELAFTPVVQSMQTKYGSRTAFERVRSRVGPADGLGAREVEYLAEAEGFYMATVTETGWPYVQHRGGPPGFLKVLSPTQLAFSDFGGNRQYVTLGNAAREDRVSIIVMDHAGQRRLKMFGHLHFYDIGDADPELVFAVELPEYPARVERVAVIDLEAFDWNCPQHIAQRFTLAEIDAAAQPLRERIAELEAEVTELRRIAATGAGGPPKK